ncbi:uncharacterized protein G2W53_022561 [Senna tora]|uniref:Uncharacterized protein n=1 Tax=Senna tora TaxID=362788 RepID=A0A834TMW0_9FABA|nr:uncharacterized protein G2W53_022561 [Senna tora]
MFSSVFQRLLPPSSIIKNAKHYAFHKVISSKSVSAGGSGSGVERRKTSGGGVSDSQRSSFEKSPTFPWMPLLSPLSFHEVVTTRPETMVVDLDPSLEPSMEVKKRQPPSTVIEVQELDGGHSARPPKRARVDDFGAAIAEAT